eukprot:NODE_25222_length_595_cov_0.901709.p1 GENE.NODE_25222_length_595_cov_0.901709~~NODE_25222_length_595_cov_0.901709.p1  ORF type:complete len:101 (+),score=13.13 NODE_25222_length_595_cov_0.901709:222-524(+)
MPAGPARRVPRDSRGADARNSCVAEEQGHHTGELFCRGGCPHRITVLVARTIMVSMSQVISKTKKKKKKKKEPCLNTPVSKKHPPRPTKEEVSTTDETAN